jgi:hypothetical protein
MYFTLLSMKAHITMYLDECVESYGLTQYSICITHISTQKCSGATECVFTLLCFTSYFNRLYIINNGMECWHESCIHSGMTYFLICQNPTYWVLICVIQMLYWVNPYDSTHSSRYIVICAFIDNNVKYIIFY